MIFSEGIHLSSNVDISRATVNYFSNLFSKEDLDARDEEREILECIPHLASVEMNGSLLRPIPLSKVEKVMFNIKKGKVPDHDGFPIEFFKEFWEIIKLDLLELVQESYRHKKMLKSMNSTFLVLIPKQEGANQLAYFRPIALSNVVYKIMFSIALCNVV